MDFDKIILELAKNNMVDVGQGDVFIKKQLKESIGGIPIYDITVDFVDEDHNTIKETKVFSSFEDLRDFSVVNQEGISMHRCESCGNLPEMDYYLDLENNQEYCSYSCLVEAMNDEFGNGNWKINDDGFNDLLFFVKISEDEINNFNEAHRDSEGWWRRYFIKHVRKYS